MLAELQGRRRNRQQLLEARFAVNERRSANRPSVEIQQIEEEEDKRARVACVRRRLDCTQ